MDHESMAIVPDALPGGVERKEEQALERTAVLPQAKKPEAKAVASETRGYPCLRLAKPEANSCLQLSAAGFRRRRKKGRAGF